ncbi:hypothetical protein [Arsenicibacter rosenii]|uniref:Uncharacterized protein n=1 Tax=Arsenicibacter rosenii TaxID=1750698 RepID=A0A1S2VAM0_9BACT|nr:hypothetical protein [Arsenicibacter rosenii]OIN55743.1 hypothetical protein BLX24_28420 [Arsenicibacter rosenii]
MQIKFKPKQTYFFVNQWEVDAVTYIGPDCFYAEAGKVNNHHVFRRKSSCFEREQYFSVDVTKARLFATQAEADQATIPELEKYLKYLKEEA